EDVGRLAEQARVLHDLDAPAAGLDHDLDAGAVAGLERPGGQQGEVSLAVAEEGGPASQQGAVEVRVDAANRHYQATSCTISASPGARGPKTSSSRPSGPASNARTTGGEIRTASIGRTSTTSSSSLTRPLPPSTR